VRIARAQNAHFTTGTGTGQPEGVQTNATVGKTGATGQTTTVILNDLIDLVHSVDPAYRVGEGVAWMMSDSALGTVRKLRDDSGGAGVGRPVIEPSVQGGLPDSLFGFPIVVNQDMPVMAANAKSILFGNFRQYYVIRDALDFSVKRLDERYADLLQVGFLGWQRSDALVQDAAAVKAYRNSAT
jgi:HK97 family phage major capsid protein